MRRDVNVAEFLRVALADVVDVELHDVLEAREEHLQQRFPVPVMRRITTLMQLCCLACNSPVQRSDASLAHEHAVAMHDVNAEEERDGVVAVADVRVDQFLQAARNHCTDVSRSHLSIHVLS